MDTVTHALAGTVIAQAGEGTTLNRIGLVYHAQWQYAQALERYKQALAIRREVGDRTREGRTLNNIGGVYQRQGRYGEALKWKGSVEGVKSFVGK